jgi:hypothetical protein
MRAIAALMDRLADASDKARPGFDPIDWPRSVVPDDEWFMTPELLSLAGLSEFEALPEPQRKRLSFFEAVNFFSLNIHGEKPLVAGLAARLYAPSGPDLAPYLHHFLEEENRHMAWFGGFCRRYAGKVYPEKRVALARERDDGAADFIFFAEALLFEEIVDAYNRTIAADERVSALARTINRLHHEDEHRHIVFGRRAVQTLFAAGQRAWSAEQIAALRAELEAFTAMTWRQYWNPDVYRDAGLADPYGLMRRAWAHPGAVARRRALESAALGWMRQAGILADDAAGAVS